MENLHQPRIMKISFKSVNRMSNGVVAVGALTTLVGVVLIPVTGGLSIPMAVCVAGGMATAIGSTTAIGAVIMAS